MIFKPELAAAVVSGEKTATRRRLSDNPRSPWFRESCAYKPGQVFTVNPGRGVANIGRARVLRVYKQLLGAMWPGDARREGFADLAEFRAAFGGINGIFNPNEEVWVVEFEAVPTPKTRAEFIKDLIADAAPALLAPELHKQPCEGEKANEVRDG